MRVLITNCTLGGRSGTEILTLNLAKALKNLGHEPSVYSTVLGPIAEEIRQLGITVTDTIDSLTEAPDIIHGHHTMETAAAAIRFPQTPAIFVCHDFVTWHDTAPKLPNIVHYYAISEGFRSRFTDRDGISPDKCSVILNGIDTQRFTSSTPLPDKPRKALIFAKNTQHLAGIQQACDQLGIAHDTVGAAVKKLTDSPETLIQDYDLVFTSAMSAMECMAAGRAVIACDGRGLAGFVSPDRYDGWRRENFGLPAFTQELTTDNFVAEIQRYNADHASAVTERVRHEAGLIPWAAQYVAAYESAIKDFTAPAKHEAANAASVFLERWSPAPLLQEWTRERIKLQKIITTLEQGLIPFPLDQAVPVLSSQYFAFSGFHIPDASKGVWSARPRCAFRLLVDAPFKSLSLHGYAYSCPDRNEYKFTLSINGVPVGEAIAPRLRSVMVFNFEPVDDTVVWVEINGEPLVSPSDYGKNDRRQIGFNLTAVTLG